MAEMFLGFVITPQFGLAISTSLRIFEDTFEESMPATANAAVVTTARPRTGKIRPQERSACFLHTKSKKMNFVRALVPFTAFRSKACL